MSVTPCGVDKIKCPIAGAFGLSRIGYKLPILNGLDTDPLKWALQAAISQR